jgi:ABC-type antimicrobial peptide transport system permease subunit
MVNHAFAQRYFPDGRATGRRIFGQGSNQALADIVGVVGDLRHRGLTSEPAPAVFLLHAQTPGYITTLVVRTAGDTTGQAAAIRRAIHEVDPGQAVSKVSTLEQDVAKVLARPKLHAALVTGFAVIALVLAVVGVYGLMAYIATRRIHEVGVRLALGATRWNIFHEMFSEGARLVGAGLAVGMAAAVGLREVASAIVFGVTTTEPVTYLVAALTFSVMALVAVTIPALRAAGVEPVRALRYE